MDKDKIIALIEQELVQADEARSEADFQKHMYAIHTLTALYTDSTPRPISQQPSLNQTSGASVSSANSTAHTKVSAAEIEAMGGKVSHSNTPSNTSTPPGNSNKMVTDDELGNGDSIFDF